MVTTVTREHAETMLGLVATWLGKRGLGTFTHIADGSACDDWRCWGDDVDGATHVQGPAPTGDEAQAKGMGPTLWMEWDWPGEPTPSVILEGGPYDWAMDAAWDVNEQARAAGIPVRVEPYSGWALCIYPE